jgi:hypothetical protein
MFTMSTFAKDPNPGKCLPVYHLFAGQRRASAHRHFIYFGMRTDVPGVD